MAITESALLLLALFVLLLALAVAFWRGVEKSEAWAKYFQGVVTSTAILVAGYLYFVERKNKPHADVTQTVEALGQGDGVVSIEAYVVIKNLGAHLLKIDHVVSRLQLVDIGPLGVENLPRLKGPDYWSAKSKTGRAAFMGPELRWRQLRLYDDRIKNDIEPGESDLITISFVFRCPPARHVRIATEIGKPGTRGEEFELETNETQQATARSDSPTTWARPAKSEKEAESELFWKARTTVDLKPVCSPGDKDTEEGQGRVQQTIKL